MYLFKLTDAFDKIKIKHLQWWIVATLLKAAALLLQQKGQTQILIFLEISQPNIFPVGKIGRGDAPAQRLGTRVKE